MGRNAAGISLCGCDHSDSIAFAETGAGFYIQRRTSDEFFSDYVEHARTWVEEVPVPEKADEAVKEEIVEHIADSIRQTAAAGSHFSGMLTPEEDEIMREIIREFMK